ncbi:MAG: hypothetical protein LC135_12315 [Phycisphaerae bacterium]|nr:hypothetical protein [Phycisphaerae bacterium]MCZ2400635.1 hypothetical protein [Phycisphaerae bacterium]
MCRCSMLGVMALLAGPMALAGGPDVIVGDLPTVYHWTTGGPVVVNGVPYRAYSVGTISCNIGDQILAWESESPMHPVIPQNMYRLHDGRLQQIGMSWLKHGYCALQQDLCGTCDPVGPLCEAALGVGCSDPYSAVLNGSQGRLGPRFEVNAYTGEFVWPFSYRFVTGDAIYKRLQVAEADLLTPGAMYFVEAMYVHPEDAAARNHSNNAGMRRVTVNPDFSISVAGSTYPQTAAVYAWLLHGKGVDQPDLDVIVATVDVPNEGRFLLGYKVTEVGAGQWRYEYALENLTSDRSAGHFSVPASGVNTSGYFFHSPRYHSGEPYDNDPWTVSDSGGVVKWSSPKTYEQDPNTNALRWATLYNFSFVANAPPVFGQATIGLFKPGSPDTVQVGTLVPEQGACPGDIDGDGDVDQADLGILLANYGQSVPPGTSGDLDGDGDVDQSDLGVLLASFGCD